MQEPTIQDLLKPNFTFGTLFKADGEQEIVIRDSANHMVSLSVSEAFNLLKYLSQVIKVEEGDKVVGNEQENSSEFN